MNERERVTKILSREITVKEINYAGKVGSYHAVMEERLKECILALAETVDNQRQEISELKKMIELDGGLQ